MKVGIKIVNQKDGKFSFISDQKLLTANCLKINQVSSLRTASKIFHHETSGCNIVGLDYSTIELISGYVIYDHARVFDIKHCNIGYCSFTDYNKKTGDTKFYIL